MEETAFQRRRFPKALVKLGFSIILVGKRGILTPATLEGQPRGSEGGSKIGINGTDSEQRYPVTAEGRGWIVAGKPAESETNGKTSFRLSPLPYSEVYSNERSEWVVKIFPLNFTKSRKNQNGGCFWFMAYAIN